MNKLLIYLWNFAYAMHWLIYQHADVLVELWSRPQQAEEVFATRHALV